jgi:hypothetical protein
MRRRGTRNALSRQISEGGRMSAILAPSGCFQTSPGSYWRLPRYMEGEAMTDLLNSAFAPRGRHRDLILCMVLFSKKKNKCLPERNKNPLLTKQPDKFGRA